LLIGLLLIFTKIIFVYLLKADMTQLIRVHTIVKVIRNKSSTQVSRTGVCSPKAELTTVHVDLPSYKISAPSRKRDICVTKVLHFWLRGLTHWPKFTKGEMTWWTPRSTILPNFITLGHPAPEISVTKYPAE